MKEIFSTKNTRIKDLRKLHKKKYRQQQQRYLIEGFHLVEEAQQQGVVIEAVFANDRGVREGAHLLEAADDVYYVSDEVLSQLADSPSPQGIVAVAKMEGEPSLTAEGGWLLLDNVQDPGNVGTMIRTADAAGLTGVIIGNGTADIYSSKVLRSMQGSQFHLRICSMDLLEAVAFFQRAAIPVYGTALNKEAKVLQEVPKQKNYAVIMGNEGQGISQSLLDSVDETIYIPIFGKAESLNVGVAAGIVMYHFAQEYF